jgi:hypothetical protein
MDAPTSTREPGPLDIVDGIASVRPRGGYSLVEAVALVSSAIALCRDRGVTRLLIDGTALTGVAIPSLVDRFLMVEEWAHQGNGVVVVALVALPEYIHPKKFGVKVALDFGLVCDVYASEDAAWTWLREVDPRTFAHDR